MKQLEELYTISEIYPIFKLKNERSLKRLINQLLLKHPKATCLNRKVGSRHMMTAEDIEEMKTLCLNL
jgi:hypothetical protein